MFFPLAQCCVPVFYGPDVVITTNGGRLVSRMNNVLAAFRDPIL